MTLIILVMIVNTPILDMFLFVFIASKQGFSMPSDSLDERRVFLSFDN